MRSSCHDVLRDIRASGGVARTASFPAWQEAEISHFEAFVRAVFA